MCCSALPSTGLHTNGYSLARKLMFDVAGYEPETLLPEVGATVGDALLEVHRSYLEADSRADGGEACSAARLILPAAELRIIRRACYRRPGRCDRNHCLEDPADLRGAAPYRQHSGG